MGNSLVLNFQRVNNRVGDLVTNAPEQGVRSGCVRFLDRPDDGTSVPETDVNDLASCFQVRKRSFRFFFKLREQRNVHPIMVYGVTVQFPDTLQHILIHGELICLIQNLAITASMLKLQMS